MGSLILLRHGQSEWNRSNRFTGWVDVDLTKKGAAEAAAAGRFLAEAGLPFDSAFTSLLKRAIRTLWVVLDVLDQLWLPVVKTWRLNERHYGALQGLDKAEMTDRYGKEQVFLWRRSFSARPPALDAGDPQHPSHDPRYARVNPLLLPGAESLEDTFWRVMPCWEEMILPRVRSGERVLVVAHGNSLRALVKHLDGISDADVPALSIPTGIPIFYELDGEGKTVRKETIGDASVVEAAVKAARQAAQVRGKSRGDEE